MDEMHVFVRVVEAGSFSAAADALGMPKSSVSRAVSRLEDRLGARLLQRTTRQLALTEVGRTYHAQAARIVAEIAEAERSVRALEEEPTGTLRLTTLSGIGQHVLGEILAEYAERYPEVRVEVLLTDRLVNLVEEGYDVAVRAGALSDSSLVARRLASIDRRIVASPEYLAERGTPSTPDDLVGHDTLLLGAPPSGIPWPFERPPVLRGRLVINDVQVLLEAVERGRGIAALPAYAVVRALHHGRVVELLADHVVRDPRAGVFVVYPAQRHLSAKVRAFVDLMVETTGADAWQVPHRCRTALGLEGQPSPG